MSISRIPYFKRIFRLRKKKTKIIYDSNIYLASYAPSRTICIVCIVLYISDRRTELSEGNGDVQVPRLLRDTFASDNWILSGDGTTPRTLHQEYARRIVHRVSSYGTN